MVLVRSFAPVHLCAFVLSFLNQIYQESPSFPGESPPVKLNSAPVFPSFLLLSDICFSLSLSLSLLNWPGQPAWAQNPSSVCWRAELMTWEQLKDEELEAFPLVPAFSLGV